MEIRRTTVEDLPRAAGPVCPGPAVYGRPRQPQSVGPTHWPPEALLRQDIAQGKSYVCLEAGRVVGTFFFTQGKDVEPTYRRIEAGAWRDDSPYGVVHRLASDGSVPGTGRFCLRWAYAQCGHLRIDTHGDNRVMQTLLEKEGFLPCGTIYVEEDPYPRIAYEKSQPQPAREPGA